MTRGDFCGFLNRSDADMQHFGTNLVEEKIHHMGGPDGTQLDGFLQVGVAKEDQPHYLKILARPDADTKPLVEYGLGVISARTRNGGRSDHGVIAPVRTYEAPIDRRLEEAGFRVESTVTLLMKETVVRVAEPSLVPAIR